MGFNDNRKYGFDEAEKIIDGLKKRGFSVMIGVPTHWRDLESDTLPDKRLHDLILKCDIVTPDGAESPHGLSAKCFKDGDGDAFH